MSDRIGFGEVETEGRSVKQICCRHAGLGIVTRPCAIELRPYGLCNLDHHRSLYLAQDVLIIEQDITVRECAEPASDGRGTLRVYQQMKA